MSKDCVTRSPNPNTESRSPKEARTPKSGAQINRSPASTGFTVAWNLTFVSDFGLRIYCPCASGPRPCQETTRPVKRDNARGQVWCRQLRRGHARRPTFVANGCAVGAKSPAFAVLYRDFAHSWQDFSCATKEAFHPQSSTLHPLWLRLCRAVPEPVNFYPARPADAAISSQSVGKLCPASERAERPSRGGRDLNAVVRMATCRLVVEVAWLCPGW